MNLLSTIQNHFSPQVVGQVSNLIGENEASTRAGLNAGIPALLGSLVGKASSSPNGANEIYNMIKQGQNRGDFHDSPSGMLSSMTSSGGLSQMMSGSGNSLLSSLFGSKLGAVGDFISRTCGLKGSSATSLLGMAAPLVMGTLGKQVNSQGLNAGGLGQLLSSQGKYLKDAMPPGLADTLGISNILKREEPPITEARRATEPMREEAEYAPTRRFDTEREIPVEHDGHRKGSVLKWAWVPLLLALGAWMLFNKNRNEGDVEIRDAGGRVDVVETVKQSDTRVTGGPIAVRTPDGQELRLSTGGAAYQLAMAGNKGGTETIVLEEMELDAQGNIAPTSGKHVQEIITVMKAYPSMKVNIVGKGDTEAAGTAHATAIKSAITAGGVDESRVTASGETGTGRPTMKVAQ